MLPHLLDPEYEHDYVWADSAYSGECFEDLLNLGGFEGLIHEKGIINHLLIDAAKTLNRVKSSFRACLENVFGGMTMPMGAKLTRKVGPERNEAWWGLKNLTFNFLRYLPRSCHTAMVAGILRWTSQILGNLANVRYSILYLCRIFSGFFMPTKPLGLVDYSWCLFV